MRCGEPKLKQGRAWQGKPVKPLSDDILEKLAGGARVHKIHTAFAQVVRFTGEDGSHIRVLGSRLPLSFDFSPELEFYSDEGSSFVNEVEKYIRENLDDAVSFATECLFEEAFAVASDYGERDFKKLCLSVEKISREKAQHRREDFQKKLTRERKLWRSVIKRGRNRKTIAKKSLQIIADLRRKKPRTQVTQKLVSKDYFNRKDIWEVDGNLSQYNRLLQENGISFQGMLKVDKLWDEMTEDERGSLFVPRKINKKREPKRQKLR